MVEKGYVGKESGVITQGRRVVKVGTLLLRNDENNVIAKNVLSYFLCFSDTADSTGRSYCLHVMPRPGTKFVQKRNIRIQFCIFKLV